MTMSHGLDGKPDEEDQGEAKLSNFIVSLNGIYDTNDLTLFYVAHLVIWHLFGLFPYGIVPHDCHWSRSGE
jgi:hypothetical protein